MSNYRRKIFQLTENGTNKIRIKRLILLELEEELIFMPLIPTEYFHPQYDVMSIFPPPAWSQFTHQAAKLAPVVVGEGVGGAEEEAVGRHQGAVPGVQDRHRVQAGPETWAHQHLTANIIQV